MRQRGIILSDFTGDPLARALARDSGVISLDVVVGPFDQVVGILSDPGAPCWQPRPDFAVVWTRPERISPAFAALLEGQTVDLATLDAEVASFAARLVTTAELAGLVVVPAWTLSASRRGSGAGEMALSGAAYALARMNCRLAEAVADATHVRLLDAARWFAMTGTAAETPKAWYLGKIPFGAALFDVAANDIRATLAAALGRTRKLIVLDLDDTLWGGTVGEDGIGNLRLGAPDPVGEALVDFQAGLRRLARRGILLALVSKNTESVALDAIDRHPAMLLRRDAFAAWRIDWQDKAANVASLAAELGLGLDATVFIDNDPAERARVATALPQVFVPDWPDNKLLYRQALDALDCFDAGPPTREDRARGDAYRVEAQRRATAAAYASRDDWLASLDLSVTAAPLGVANAKRAVQLLNKTNQMNLRTRRVLQADFVAWAARPGVAVIAFDVADRFGDYGLTALASVAVEGRAAMLVDYVLSCRVLGRGVEQAVLAAVADAAEALGAVKLTIELVPTDRNQPCAELLANDPSLIADPTQPGRYIRVLGPPPAASRPAPGTTITSGPAAA